MGVPVPAKLRTSMHVPVKVRSLDEEHAAVLPVQPLMTESTDSGLRLLFRRLRLPVLVVPPEIARTAPGVMPLRRAEPPLLQLRVQCQGRLRE